VNWLIESVERHHCLLPTPLVFLLHQQMKIFLFGKLLGQEWGVNPSTGEKIRTKYRRLTTRRLKFLFIIVYCMYRTLPQQSHISYRMYRVHRASTAHKLICSDLANNIEQHIQDFFAHLPLAVHHKATAATATATAETAASSSTATTTS